MRDARAFASVCAGIGALFFSGCGKDSSPAGSGGTSGPVGTGGSGGLWDAGDRGVGGAITDASPDVSIVTSIDAEEYASLDGPSGCGLASAPAGVFNDQTITVGGQARTYVLSVPKTYDPSTPLSLVFAWHGSGGSGFEVRQLFALEPAAAGSAIFVYPDAAGSGWDWSPTGIDVALFDALVNYLTGSYCIDRNRILSTGLSHGAFFTNVLGCCRGNVLRAIAPVAGGPPNAAACAGRVGAWVAHAANDGLVDFNTFGVGTRDFWIASSGCSTTLAPVATGPGDCVEYQGCLPDLPVVWCVHSEGHAWPSMANCYDGGVCFDAGPAIWAFFARFE
jgi:polyhydroxybutyrate depolymerase